MQEIIEFLNSNEYEIQIRWINKFTCGIIDNKKEIIVINLWLMIADTMIHEFLHYKYPKASEREILAKTFKKLNRLTVKQIYDLAVKVVDVSNETKEK